jgi:tetratricopeptide (TPR) repeat protein
VLWRARNDLPRALEDMERVLKLETKDRAARIARAELLTKLDRLDGALAAWDALLAEQADDVEAIAGRGKVRAAQGDAAGARADILRALELDPGDPAARLVRAGFREAAQEWRDALEDLDFAINAGAGGGEAYRRRAAVRLRLDDTAGARSDIEAALRHGAVSAWLYFTRARMRLDDGDLEGAATDLDRAVQIEPRNADAHVARGELAHARGKFDEALISYDRAVQLDAKNKVLRAQRGFVRADAGNRRGAIKDLEFAAGEDNAASIKERDLRIKIRTRLAEIRVEEARGGR